jgi:hypothetical protein
MFLPLISSVDPFIRFSFFEHAASIVSQSDRIFE